MQKRKTSHENKPSKYSTSTTPLLSTAGSFERLKALTRAYQAALGFGRLCLLLMPTMALGQCITDTANFPWDTFNECWSAPLNATDEFPVTCPSWYNGGGFVYEFYSDGVNPVSIIVDSKFNYTFDPEGSIWAHAFISDGCDGPTIWSTSNGCAVPSYVNVIYDSSPNFDWHLDILLPEGLFYFHIGNVGLSEVQYDIEGCMDVLIGTAGALNLGVPRYVREGQHWQMNYDVLGRLVR